MEEKRYSISETAKRVGVHRTTVHRWIAAGLVPPPIAENIAGIRLRYWTADGFARVKEYYKNHFGKGKGKRSDLKKNRVGNKKGEVN
jgi:hypothetical protein